MTWHSSSKEQRLHLFQEGQFIVVDKPLGWTSFDVVRKARNLLSKHTKIRRLKVGHAGTLDPLATGVMVLCTGRYTKRIEEVQQQSKTYVATLKLGATTPSFDLETEVDAVHPWEHITCVEVERVLRGFEGEQDQVPPLFSAVKVQGQRAYQMARQGEQVELAPKQIYIEEIKLLQCELPEVTIEVKCGKGTYIRSLARDVGEALGSGAHLVGLRRTAVGGFTEALALSVEGELETYIVEQCQRMEEHIKE